MTGDGSVRRVSAPLSHRATDAMLEPDLASAQRFLDALSGDPGAAHTFQVLPDGGASTGTAMVRHGTLDELGPLLVEANASHRMCVSVTVCETDGEGRRRENILRPRAVFLDFDEGLPDSVLELKPGLVVRTARGGHVYWLVAADATDWGLWDTLQGELAARYGAERHDRGGITDRTKALRMPGLWHQKGDPVLVRLEHCDPTRAGIVKLAEAVGVDPARARRRAASDRKPRVLAEASQTPLSQRQLQYERWLADLPPSAVVGTRHEQLVKALMGAGDHGLNVDEAWPCVQAYNDRSEPPLDARELWSQLTSAMRSRRGDFGKALRAPRPPEPPPPDDDDAPPPGPKRGRPERPLFLDPKDPLPSAQKFVEVKHTDGGQRTLHRQGKVYYDWRGHHYCERSDESVEAALWWFTAGALKWEGGGNVSFAPDRAAIGNVERALRAVTALNDETEAPCWIDPRPDDPDPADLLCCQNGTVNLRTGLFGAPDPRLFVLNSLGVHYSPEAPPPKHWLGFLEQLWEDDPLSQQLLQEWFGYCLTPDISHHKALIIVGPPRAGKGTIAHVLRGVLGHRSVGSLMMSDFTSQFGLWPLLDKTLSIIPDARISGRADQSAIVERFLAVTGGDVVNVDRKSLRPVHVRLNTRFMILTNVVPQLADAAAAFPQRMLPLSLERTFSGQEDRSLLGRLMAELPGILNWAIAGWHRLRERGHFQHTFGTAQPIMDAMLEASSPVGAFVRQCCVLEPSAFTPTKELFDAYRRWADDQGRHAGSASTFGRNLRAAIPQVMSARPREADGRARGFSGITVDHRRVPEASDRREPGAQRGFDVT